VNLHILGSTLPGAAATFALEIFMTILNDEMMGWNRSFKLGSYSQEVIYSHQRDRSADEKM
jgi:hypothetical protein